MDPLQRFGFLLRDVARLSSKNFERRAIAEQLGLTLEQCRVLVYLEKNQGISQARLAYLIETGPMTLVRILDLIEKKGWVERRRDPNDRRIWRLYLCADAKPILQRIATIAKASRQDALAAFDAAQSEQLLQLLDKVYDNLAALVPNASGEGRQTDVEAAAAAAKSDKKIRKSR